MKSYYSFRPSKVKKGYYSQKKFIEPVNLPVKRLMFMLSVLIILFSINIYNRVFILNSSIKLSNLQKDLFLESKINQNISIRIQALKSPSRISNFARKNLNMIYPSVNNIVIFTEENEIDNEYLAKL